jgi:hypothetical protein
VTRSSQEADRASPSGRLITAILTVASLAGIVAGGVISITADPKSGWWLLGSSLVGISGAVFGAVFGLSASSWAGNDALRLVQTMLDDHAATFTHDPHRAILSSPDLLEPWRRKMHHYHLTVIDGQQVWRYRVFRFDTARTSNGHSLELSLETKDPRTRLPAQYEVVLGVRDSRLLFVQQRKSGHEPSIIEVFPHGSEGFRHCVAGVAFLQNWDGGHMTTKCLISREPLIDDRREGVALDAAGTAELERKWHEIYTDTNLTASGS